MMACSYIQQISAYTSDLGYTAGFAATMNSLVLGIMAVGKIVLGQLYDKKGTFFASLLGNFCLMGALLCLITVVGVFFHGQRTSLSVSLFRPPTGGLRLFIRLLPAALLRKVPAAAKSTY